MAGFLRIRYNADGLLKNRIINADSIDVIEPFPAPAAVIEETRSRIFAKDGTKYDMSLTIDEIQKLLCDAGALVVEVQSTQPESRAKVTTLPTGPVSPIKRPVLVKQSPEKIRKTADNDPAKPAEISRA